MKHVRAEWMPKVAAAYGYTPHEFDSMTIGDALLLLQRLPRRDTQ